MSLIDLYLQYHKMRTNSPENYGRHLCIQLIGHSLGRDSYCSIRPRAVHFNTNVCLIGDSGKVMKSTGQEEVMFSLIPAKYRGPSNFTPQGLMRELSDASQLLCPMGEFSTYLRGIYNGGYMADFKEIVNDLFNSPDTYSKRLAGDNSYYIIQPYLSLNTTVTPEEFFGNIKEDMVDGGFLPRWILVYDELKSKGRRGSLHPQINTYETLLQGIFRTMYKYYENHSTVLTLSKEAEEHHYQITSKLYEDKQYDKIHPFISRIENYIISYSCILYVSDVVGTGLNLNELNELSKLNELNELMNDMKNNLFNLDNTINTINSMIDKSYVEQAWKILEPVLKYSAKVSKYVKEDLVVKKLVVQLDKIEQNTKIGWSELMRSTGLNSSQFALATSTLKAREEIVIDTVIKGSGRAKSIAKYITKKEK